MEIEFNGQLTRAELFKAVRLVNQPSPRSRVIRITLGVLAILLLLYAAVSSAIDGELSASDQARLGQYLFTVLLVEAYLFQPFILPYFAARKLWSNPQMQTSDVGSANETGVTYRSGTSSRTYPWADFAHVYKAQDLLALVTADRTLCPFSRSFFASPSDWDRFLSIVDTRVTPIQR